MEIREVSISDVLKARDARVELQQRMLEQYHMPLISFTMNIAGPVKYNAWIDRAFREGIGRIEAILSGRRAKVLDRQSVCAFTGCEQIWVVEANAHELKSWMRLIEEQDDLGRLFDIDVISADGEKLSRSSERSCLICGGPVRVCARSRAHSVPEIFNRTHEIIEQYFKSQFAQKIALIAEQSLLYEVATTPKPGLVDFENNGAHSDMDRFTFIDSACVLREYFQECARAGIESSGSNPTFVFNRIRSLGQQAEMKMLAATGGVNTHKGALFSLGILCCASGMQFDRPFSMNEMLSHAAALAYSSLLDFEGLSPEHACTGGEKQFISGGLTGVRGEAASGFPSVCKYALPALQAALAEGKDANDAGLSALLCLMEHLEDSNVLRRTGEDGLSIMQNEAKNISPSDLAALREMNIRFTHANLSPGGCADLLAVAWFLHKISA